MPSPVSLTTVSDMATATPIGKFVTMNPAVTQQYGRLLNTGLYFQQPHGKMSVRLIQEAMGIAFFRVKHVVIINEFEAVVNYCPSETRVSDYLLSTFNGDFPDRSGVFPIECYRIDDKLSFYQLQDLAFVYILGISLMGHIPTGNIFKNPQYQDN